MPDDVRGTYCARYIFDGRCSDPYGGGTLNRHGHEGQHALSCNRGSRSFSRPPRVRGWSQPVKHVFPLTFTVLADANTSGELLLRHIKAVPDHSCGSRHFGMCLFQCRRIFGSPFLSAQRAPFRSATNLQIFQTLGRWPENPRARILFQAANAKSTVLTKASGWVLHPRRCVETFVVCTYADIMCLKT